jgi:6-phosphogluconolactonase
VSGEPTIRVLDDAEATSGAAAEAIADALRDAVERRGRADWATTGGSTPVGIYKALVAEPLRDAVPWEAVHVWWGDDRFVPRDHPLSNVQPFDSIMLANAARAGLSGTGADAVEVDLGIEAGVPIPVQNVHAPPMAQAIGRGTGPGSAAMDYEAELREAGFEVGEDGFPVFDVVLVGIGPDGHVLSVFPSSPLFEAETWVSAVPAPTHVEPHVPRISLHPKVLDAARSPIAVVHGAGKAEILASVLGPERDPLRWPAQIARRPGATWFLDRDAAASLPA